jgi:hypothetical protein
MNNSGVGAPPVVFRMRTGHAHPELLCADFNEISATPTKLTFILNNIPIQYSLLKDINARIRAALSFALIPHLTKPPYLHPQQAAVRLRCREKSRYPLYLKIV